MANYLQLVNKVLEESGKELDPLTEATWLSAEAGKRIYPRVKRNVAEAWKTIQMKRNEWEFNSGSFTTTVIPKLKYMEGEAASIPAAGSQWRGRKSNTVVEVLSVTVEDGLWGTQNAQGQIEFTLISGSNIEAQEIFDEEGAGIGAFTYVEKGSYDFLDKNAFIREPRWTTFVAGKDSSYPNPVYFVPWDNFAYKSYSYVGGSRTVPSYVSQDFEGNMVFYPQPLTPFTLSFIHDKAPSELVEPLDIPVGLPEEYHSMIAWKALMKLARFDKDPNLFAYASEAYTEYYSRAERNLMPIPGWRVSRYFY